jgi:hemerythrin-like domain-containing protein/nucleotide-binding universal stress UspA family protein
MYRHLLVPVDGSDVSIELVGNAVGLARALGAKISYCAAQRDAARARVALAKAQAAARASGVACDTIDLAADRLHGGVADAARRAGCDLIVMAAHGPDQKPGLAATSDALRTLMHAGLPVLMTLGAEPGPAARAIGVLRDEHRSLAAVLQAWTDALARARNHGGAPDPTLMRAIVHYLREFPLALHHPKEEAFLFRRLRERTRELDAELDELERQHRRDTQWVDELDACVAALADAGEGEAGAAALEALAAAAGRYADFVWNHLGREEGVVLPAARRHLSDADWAEIDRAFAANAAPRLASDTAGDCRQLFARIVELAAG